MAAPTDNAMIYQDVRLGLEAVAGTAVAATRRLQSLKIVSKPKQEVSGFKASGSKYTNAVSYDAEWDEPELSGRPTYNEMPYLFAGAGQRVAAGTLVPGTANTYDWTYNVNTYAPDVMASYSLEYGSEVRGENHAGVIFKALGFTFPRRGESSVSGTLLAPRIEDNKLRYVKVNGAPTGGTFTLTVNGQTTGTIVYNASAAVIQAALEALSSVGAGNVVCLGGPVQTTPVRTFFRGTLADVTAITVSANGAALTGGTSAAAVVTRLYPTVTETPPVLIQGNQIDIFAAATYAALTGGSRALRFFNYTWNLSDRNDAIWEFNTSLPSYADTIEGEPSGEVTITMGADEANMATLGRLRRSEPLFVRLLAQGLPIETVAGTTYSHAFRLDTCLRPLSVGEKKAAGMVVSRDVKFDFGHDPAWGQSWQAYVRTTTAAL